MKSCFEGHKRGCIYHSYKSPIICVIPFCVLPLLEDVREIQHPIPQGDCPNRQSRAEWKSWRNVIPLVLRSNRMAFF